MFLKFPKSYKDIRIFLFVNPALFQHSNALVDYKNCFTCQLPVLFRNELNKTKLNIVQNSILLGIQAIAGAGGYLE